MDVNQLSNQSWQAILIKYKLKGLSSYVTGSVGNQKTSHVIWRIACDLRDREATPGEVATVLLASVPFRQKHGEDMRALEGEVVRAFQKRRV